MSAYRSVEGSQKENDQKLPVDKALNLPSGRPKIASVPRTTRCV